VNVSLLVVGISSSRHHKTYSVLSDRDTWTLESFILSEGKVLSYITTRTHKNSQIPGNRISTCTFHSVHKLSSISITSPVCCTPDVFSWKRDNDPFLTCTTDILKCGPSSHKSNPPSAPISWFFAPCRTGNYNSVFRCSHRSAWCCARAVGLWSEFVVWQYCT